MKTYDIDKVGGGIYCQMDIGEENSSIITNSLKNSDDRKCYNCGGDHYFKNCDKLKCFTCGGNHLMHFCPSPKNFYKNVAKPVIGNALSSIRFFFFLLPIKNSNSNFKQSI